MARRFEGKIALVTGGSAGIGLATANAFIDEGAYVFVTGRRKPELDAAVSMLGPKARAVQADASSNAELDELYSLIRREKGFLDVLFVNAAVSAVAPLGQITEEQFDVTFATNVKGVLFTVQKALPLMREGGAIVINGSISSERGDPALSLYAATKAAVRSFARGWTNDLKDRKIRVNVVSPGPINTPGLNSHTANDDQKTDLHAQLSSFVPLGRIGEPPEVAKAALFLASEDASFVAGSVLFVDGGAAQV